MIIECTLKRDEPIVVPIGNEKYHFEDDGNGRKVAEVWVERHVEAFLAVPHLYREVKDAEAITQAYAQAGRKELVAALRERKIKFVVTESNDALRAKLTAADSASPAAQ